jgi:ketosteroid isomerase-like protein
MIAAAHRTPPAPRLQLQWPRAHSGPCAVRTMSRGNADLVPPIYERWGRGDWRLRFDVYDPHMEWGWSDEFPGLAGVFEDHRDPNPRLRAWLSGWEHWRVEAEDFLEIDDHVVVLAGYHGRGKGSGVEVHQRGAHVFDLRNGKVVRLEMFADRERAIESVRVSTRRG